MKKAIKRILMFIGITLLILVVLIFAVLQQEKFGKAPSGERLEMIKKSPNYKNNSFQNLHHTPSLTESSNYFSIIKEFAFSKKIRMSPALALPSVKTDLTTLAPQNPVVIWFGHSSYFIQIDGKKILVDPVLSGSISPIGIGNKSFNGSDIYKVDEIPDIDYLFITHDHWDHLDYQTVKKLEPRVSKVICALGTGEHLEAWGYPKEKIIEKDWNETIPLDSGFIAHTVPARHFSGRGLIRNKSLWTSFALQTPTKKIFIGGDSGYDTHFSEAGTKFGPFDLAILECGQYDKSWRYIHMLPDEVLKAADDLKAKQLLAVHAAKFALGNHSWDDPFVRIDSLLASGKNDTTPYSFQLLTPMIGEKVIIGDSTQLYTKWWQGLD